MQSLAKEYLTANMAEKHRRSKNNTVKIPAKNKKIIFKNAEKSQKIMIKNIFRLKTLNIFIADCTKSSKHDF